MQEWEPFEETWSAFESTNPHALNTVAVRQGWCKPTIYREHEVIHRLASALDQTRLMLENEENHHRACDEALEKRIGLAEDKLERVEAVLKEAMAGPFNSDTADLIYELREALK